MTLAFGATRGAEFLGRGHAAISTIFHATLWLRAGVAVVLAVPHGRRALAVIGGAAEGAVFLAAGGFLAARLFIAAWRGFAGTVLTLFTVGIATGLRVFAFTFGIGAGCFAAWWGFGLA